jgi:hypothetical protein
MDKKPKTKLFKMSLFAILLVLLAAALWGPIVSNVEQAKYAVTQTEGAFELRDYAPMIVAEVSVSGEREEAINQGFRLIADYIFGNNTISQKVEMTAPVLQQPSEKIAMTTPVMQQPDGNSWTVSFVMPSAYSLEKLPKPNNPKVLLKVLPGKSFAALRFSGIASKDKLALKTEELMKLVKSKNLKTASLPVYAFFNPPWTLPFLRRNEVMIELSAK